MNSMGIAKGQNKPFTSFPIIILHFFALLLELFSSFSLLPWMTEECNASGGVTVVLLGSSNEHS